jgi:hypothetical protein
MTCDPDKHHRRSIRLRGYDYALAGAYFVTMVTQDRACLLGEVVAGAMRLNDAGRMVRTVWDDYRSITWRGYRRVVSCHHIRILFW